MIDRPSPPEKNTLRAAAARPLRPVFAWLAVAVAYGAWLAIFMPLIPADGGALGYDYSLHLPNQLAGYFFFVRNGLFAVPWFNPGECGGVPFIADLNVAYYALPQALTVAVDPLTAARATVAIFAAIGAIGFYLLARTRFAASPAASAVAAGLFLFNGFYAYRMAIGHLTFHPFALAPWVAVVLLPPLSHARSAWNTTRAGGILAALVAGGLFAYMFQAGMIHGIAPLVLAVAAIVLIHGIVIGGAAWRPWAILAGAGVVALALSASRLSAALAFLKNFPRDAYPLPGFASPLAALRFALESLFVLPPTQDGWAALLNTDPILDRPEWEYGVGPAAAVLIVAAAVAIAVSFLRGSRRGGFVRHWPSLLAIVVILALPLVVNWYVPAWNAILKSLPVIGSSTTLVRWFMLYIPVVALLAGLSFDRIVGAGSHALMLAAVLAATVLGNVVIDKSYYRSQHYVPAKIASAWQAARSSATVPPVTAIVAPPEATAARYMILGSNDALAEGGSQIFCYQPMFGYQLQTFVRGSLHPGPILDQSPAGTLNLKNPACDLFPGQNNCRPGDEFRVDQIAAARAFAAYEPFPFTRSTVQAAADWLNLAALIGFIVTVPILLLGQALRTR